jgi:tetratricopeptide (TPR) repeat protein
MTITSVVFRPIDRSLWLAVGPAPTSNRAFAAFSLEREGPLLEVPDLTGGMLDDPDAVAAFDAYREAYEAYFTRQDAHAARPHLARAIELQPAQSVYRFVAGLMAMAAGASEEAEQLFTRAIELGHAVPARRAAFHLWRGRARDLNGRRERAMEDYERVRGSELEQSAARHLSRPYRQRPFGIDMMYADAA